MDRKECIRAVLRRKHVLPSILEVAFSSFQRIKKRPGVPEMELAKK